MPPRLPLLLLLNIYALRISVLALSSPRVAVVGGGIGGLVTSGILSSRGLSVTLIEKNCRLGGRAGGKEVEVEGNGVKGRFEVGPSLLLLPDVYNDCAFNMGTTKEGLGWDIKECPGGTYGVGYDDGGWVVMGGEVGVPEGMRRWVEVNDFMLKLGLPLFIEADVGKLDGNWFGDVMGLMEGIVKHGYNPFGVLNSVAHKMVAGSKPLKLASTFQSLYVGLTPNRPGSTLSTVSPALFGLLSAMEMIGSKRDVEEGRRKIHGVHYVEGGFGTIVKGIVRLLEDRNVDIRVGRGVERIEECKDERGGVLVDGERFDAVVCNVEVDKANDGLISSPRPPPPKKIMSSSVLQFHWIVEGEEAKNKLRAHNVFLSDDNVGSWDAVRAGDPSIKLENDGERREKIQQPPFNFYVHNPGCGDDTACVGGGTVLMALVPIAAGSKITKKEVKQWEGWVKQRVEKRTGGLNLLHSECTTPKKWEEDYGLPGGAVFGAAHGLLQLGPTRQGCNVPGMKGCFYVGASKRPGNGVPLVMIGAEKTALEVVKYLKRHF